MIKQVISWILIALGILCIYINIAHVLSEDQVRLEVEVVNIVRHDQEDEFLLEDEPVPGGRVKEEHETRINKETIQLGAIVIMSIGLGIDYKNKIL